MSEPRDVMHLPEDEQERLLHKVMQRQVSLSIKVALAFILLLIGLPLFNLYLPELAATKVGGFTLSWLVLGVLFYPITWVLSQLFVRRSESIEDALTSEIAGGKSE